MHHMGQVKVTRCAGGFSPPVPGLISCTGGTGSSRITAHVALMSGLNYAYMFPEITKYMYHMYNMYSADIASMCGSTHCCGGVINNNVAMATGVDAEAAATCSIQALPP